MPIEIIQGEQELAIAVAAGARRDVDRMAATIRSLWRSHAYALTGFEGWEPTSEAINELPEPVRRYVHDLETRCDPAGEVRDLTMIKAENEQLRKALEDVKADADVELEEVIEKRDDVALVVLRCRRMEDPQQVAKMAAAIASRFGDVLALILPEGYSLGLMNDEDMRREGWVRAPEPKKSPGTCDGCGTNEGNLYRVEEDGEAEYLCAACRDARN